MELENPISIGVLTSGGDAQGMNAALRAVVRTGLARGAAVHAIAEGYAGMVEGGTQIRRLDWRDVGGIIHRGGTAIGTARSATFRTREGRLEAARNLLERGIDRLVVIGGDGSLTGADLFRREWSSLLAELVESGRLTPELAARHPQLGIVGLVGSIDNDFWGTDMTIGADSALHRITEAIDALSSTAASHQRSFVVEVMGRHCGYLALMGAVAGGADYVLIPESPPDSEDWESDLCELVRAGRAAGRRDSIVVVAEGARDRIGNPITGEHVRALLEQRLGEDTRVTILGHVQRGGAPGAFDRWMSSLLGYHAVEQLLASDPAVEPRLIGLRNNRIVHQPLMTCVANTRAVAEAIKAHDYRRAMELRGGSFGEMFDTFKALSEALPTVARTDRSRRIAVLTAGVTAPGMNTAVRAAIRLGLDRGYRMLAVRNGFDGLIGGMLEEFNWGSVDGWGPLGGAELGAGRRVPQAGELAAIEQTLRAHEVDALLVIGGISSYQAAHTLHQNRSEFTAFDIPIVCLPASIDNNLPGSELSIGADTALNTIVDALDKIKQSAVSARRCFVVEVMGYNSGYLALMSALAGGAERVYLPEEGMTLRDLEADLEHIERLFARGQRVALLIRSEHANPLYTAEFIRALFEQEGGDRFDARQAILGHIQQGGSPSPYDRVQATRLAARCIAFLDEQLGAAGRPGSAAGSSAQGAFIGYRSGKVELTDLAAMPGMLDERQRPKEQWWLSLRPIERLLARAAVD